MKKLAVVLPTFNSAIYIGDALESLLSQTFQDFDVFIYDDFSSDNTEEIVKSFKSDKFFYIKNESNLGIAKTLNLAISKIINEYEFIARMDADDWCFSDRFKIQIDFLSNSSVDICGSQGYWLKSLDDEAIKSWSYKNSYSAIKYFLLFSSCFGHSSIMFKTKSFSANDFKYDETLKTVEDWELWTRLIKKNKMVNVPDFLMKYRVLNNSNHRSPSHKKRHLIERSIIIAEYWKSFGIEATSEFIYQSYFKESNRSFREFKPLFLSLISMFNSISELAISEMKSLDYNDFRYRLTRQLKNFIMLNKFSNLDFRILLLLHRNVRYSNSINTLKWFIK